jgi:ribonuclease D
MALGLGEQVGYQNLVESLLGKHLDKGARFTDWARRPLDARQIDYAIGDVTHLGDPVPRMLERLRETGRATGSTRRWSGWRIRPITSTIPARRGSA